MANQKSWWRSSGGSLEQEPLSRPANVSTSALNRMDSIGDIPHMKQTCLPCTGSPSRGAATPQRTGSAIPSAVAKLCAESSMASVSRRISLPLAISFVLP
jgi:hypothetical protein